MSDTTTSGKIRSVLREHRADIPQEAADYLELIARQVDTFGASIRIEAMNGNAAAVIEMAEALTERRKP